MHVDLCSKGLRHAPAGDRGWWYVLPFLPTTMVLLMGLALVGCVDFGLVPRTRQATLCWSFQIPLLFQL
jgi:uncharacterized membrane protein SirB2